MTNQGWAYDPAANTWSALPNANFARYRAAAACGFTTAAGVAQPGTYTAQLGIRSSTPYAVTPIGVTMTVRPPGDWGKLTGIVTGVDRAAPGAGPAHARTPHGATACTMPAGCAPGQRWESGAGGSEFDAGVGAVQ
ncbi:Kelch repeat-containing protein [Sphaerisporangium perillae]|uniref:Kelch repeat-containing protein n=1 Tax=Sphaerisporangium perillae TaxID=2935860 RepID=UPI0020103C1E|nr:kelch repeat-containing protein [Sphaerisporangium perillae]